MKSKVPAKKAAGVNRRDFLKLSATTGAAAALGVSAPAIAQQARTWRFGHMVPADSVYHRAIRMFGDEMAKLSSNKIKVDIFPSSQLGSISDMLRSVQAGSLTMSMAVPAWYSNFIKPLDVFTLPYLVSSPDRLHRAVEGTIGTEISKYAETAGFKVIGYWLIGPRHIANNVRPVNKPADCQGLKVRVLNSQVYMQTFRALGANPVAMDPSELYLALQQHVVDGFEYPLPDLVEQKMYEVTKFLSLDAHTTDFFIMSTSKNTWASFSPEEQSMVAKAMKTAMDWQWKVQPDETAKALAKLQTVLKVNDITPENKELFIKQTAPLYQQFEGSIGKSFLDMAIKDLR